MAYTSRLLNAIPGIRHAFLNVHETAAFAYAELAPVKLVHGNEVHHYQQPLPTRPHADAVFTAVAGQKVGVVTADCLPLLIASRDGRYVCSVHAGWQGLVSDPLKAAARGSDNLWFDLRAFAEAIFAEAGVAPTSVEWLGSCTYCTPQSLGSYRRRTHFPAPKSFQYSWIMREA